jgi:predicted transposase/invertase (TIGR01784 family)
METDSFFCQLFKQMPQTLFEPLGLPAERARAYRFDSVEVKKSLRIDGIFLPRRLKLPLYFVEVQFRSLATFYANLFAKVFWYLEENDPAQDWLAVAVFPSRNVEPKNLAPYQELLQSRRVRRIYLNEYPMPAARPWVSAFCNWCRRPSARPGIWSSGCFAKRRTKFPILKWEPKW